MLKKLRTFAVMLFAFGFLFSATLNSCGNKKTDGESTEHHEHDEHLESEEHPAGAEHPTEGEHPTDTTGAGGEHPNN